MNDFYKVVDSLETKLERYLEMQEELKRTKVQLESEIDDLKTKEIQYANEIARWKEKNQSLKLANSLLGSDQFKRETKLKINALIREIDLCIAQLSI